MFKTGTLSERFDIDRTTLNYYVRSGLLKPQVLENNYHAFSDEDAVALAQVRYYLGVGFETKNIQQFLYESEPADILASAERKQAELADAVRKLQLRQAFLQNFTNFLRFVQQPASGPAEVVTEPYYFLQKEDLTDPALRELFKMIPFNEYSFDVDPDYAVHENTPVSLGLALTQSWVSRFHLPLPERCLFYPGRRKLLQTFRLTGPTESRPAQMRDQLRALYESQQAAGRTLARHFEAYSLLTHYTGSAELIMMGFFSFTEDSPAD